MVNKTWCCPVCGCSAFQRFGGHYEKGIKYGESGVSPEEISIKIGQHFMCKGCSVFFNNPNAFNKDKIDGRK